jgi:hypothetical protein
MTYKVPPLRPERRLRPTTNWKRWRDGWLSPDGKFYGCEKHKHIALGNVLGDHHGLLEHRGWLKLQGGFWVKKSRADCYNFPPEQDWPTQAQIDAVFDRSVALKCRLPEWAGGKKDE